MACELDLGALLFALAALGAPLLLAWAIVAWSERGQRRLERCRE